MKTQNGFTLIELLIVIAIIAVLAGLLFPVFAAARENGRKITCVSNLRQIGIGIALYTQDYDAFLPYAPNQDTKDVVTKCHAIALGDPLDERAAILPDVRTVLKPYVVPNLVYQCPDDQLDPASMRACLHPKNTYFATFGSSYNYNDRVGLSIVPLSYFQQPSDSLLMQDYDCWHNRTYRDSCTPGFWDVLFADFHVKMCTILQREEALDNADSGL
jgi:prepilin-type N-terminal cleavage/methylation domain-containing protein